MFKIQFLSVQTSSMLSTLCSLSMTRMATGSSNGTRHLNWSKACTMRRTFQLQQLRKLYRCSVIWTPTLTARSRSKFIWLLYARNSRRPVAIFLVVFVVYIYLHAVFDRSWQCLCLSLWKGPKHRNKTTKRVQVDIHVWVESLKRTCVGLES